MKINELKSKIGSTKKRKRVGRGPGSGHGKTSCRGHKGQKSRTGGGVALGFEGGQMPLQRRLPKRGFSNCPFGKYITVVNLDRINEIIENADTDISEITPEFLKEKRLIKRLKDGLKILAKGELKKPIIIKANAFSERAREKIIAAGGKAEVI